jgi:SAM-dependent methyltransferase
MKEIVVKWNREYFDGKLSLACLEELDKTDDKNRELVELIDTWLYYFHAAGGRAQNFSSLLARFFATVAASYLPSLWARIPPITRGGRLRGMDRIAHEVLGFPAGRAIRFLDVGCGYPPLTTVDTAEECIAWSCVGIDPNFPAWILHDEDGNAACFDETGAMVYIQYLQGDLQPGSDQILKDRQRYSLEWDRVSHDPALEAEVIRAKRLVRNPAAHFGRSNLSFSSTSLMGMHTVQPFDFIRCMNVFMYFDGRAILDHLRYAKSLLSPQGVFVCGSVNEIGVSAKYLAYRKRRDVLTPWLFGFDLGKFSQREGNGFWGFHKDQPDTLFLASVIRMVSENQHLLARVTSVIDRVEEVLGTATRDRHGYLREEESTVSGTVRYSQLLAAVGSECGEEIVTFLGSRGLSAEINPSGHLLIDLPGSSPSLYERYFPLL